MDGMRVGPNLPQPRLRPLRPQLPSPFLRQAAGASRGVLDVQVYIETIDMVLGLMT